MLTVGDKIPSFSLINDSGDTITDKSFAGKTVVLYFYPKDDTPGCTREAIAFTQNVDAFRGAGAEVVGVSRDSLTSHINFKNKYALKIPLLSDPELQLHRAFGAWGMKVMYGEQKEGVLRSTFIIDKYGTVVRVFASVKVDGHAEAVLAALTGEPAPISNNETMMPPAKKAKAAAKAKSKLKLKSKATTKSKAKATTKSKPKSKAKAKSTKKAKAKPKTAKKKPTKKKAKK
ncbi:MAG: peroxiredoxin [Polyangiaceae bacterium]